MKTIEIEIQGDSALLMNSPKMMLVEEPIIKQVSSKKKRDFKSEAEDVAYRKKNLELYVPNTAIKGCLLNASSMKRTGKYALKPFIAGGVKVEPEEIGLGIKTYEVDLRTIVNKLRGRLLKARPKIKDWKLKFKIIYNENMITADLIKQVLKDGGERIGILDFRPINNGEFGTFHISKWKEV